MTKGNRKRPVSDQPDQTQPKSKSRKSNGGKPQIKQGTLCSVCNKIIIERSSEHDGEEAIYCEKRCGWMHRQCAGLTDPFFKLFTENDTPFLCVYCMLKSQSDEICALKATIKEMEKTLAILQKSTNATSEINLPLDLPNNPISQQLNDPTSRPAANSESTNVNLKTSSQHDRKYNVVVFGITEPPSGSSLFARAAKDTDNVTKLFETINPDFCSTTLRDCFRLGRYKKDQTRPRPILVKLNRTVDVANILSNRDKYPNEINIKPDLTKEERSCESKLLAERWRLMQSGTDKKLIKIKKSSIYVKGKLHGSVKNSAFCLVEQPPTNSDMDLEPSLNSHLSPGNTMAPTGASDSNI